MKTAIGLLIALATNTFAAVQSSANYKVLSDVIDAGGKHCTSASYSNDGSVGGFGGLIAASAPQETVRTGYAGQLYEITAFTLTAPSTHLNEATSMPMFAVQVLDDDTVSRANGFVEWSFSGPLTGVNAAGIVTAAYVYQNTPASVVASLEGWSASFNLMVMFTGMPPGYNQITSQLLSGGNMRLSYVGSNGMNYSLDRSYNLSPPINWVPQMTNSAGVDGLLIFTNLANASTNNFWRIRSVP